MWLGRALLGGALVSCGSVGTPPAAGDLLSAPTTLSVNGRLLTADATPTLSGKVFRVQVKVRADRAPLPALNVTGLFVVTNEGVWKAPVGPDAQRSCGVKLCTQGSASSAADGFQAGEGVQVVARVQDAQGRTYWLRDAQVRVLRAAAE